MTSGTLALKLNKAIHKILGERWVRVGLLNEREVALSFERVVREKQLKTIDEIDVALEYYADHLSDRNPLPAIYENAVDCLSFATETSRGILYSGLYRNMRVGRTTVRAKTETLPGGHQMGWIGMHTKEWQMWQAANEHATATGKSTIALTEGGKWMAEKKNALRAGDEEKKVFWAAASAKYAAGLKGEVDVFLAYPNYEGVFRSIEAHALMQNKAVRKITYYLEHWQTSTIAPADLRATLQSYYRKT